MTPSFAAVLGSLFIFLTIATVALLIASNQ